MKKSELIKKIEYVKNEKKHCYEVSNGYSSILVETICYELIDLSEYMGEDIELDEIELYDQYNDYTIYYSDAYNLADIWDICLVTETIEFLKEYGINTYHDDIDNINVCTIINHIVEKMAYNILHYCFNEI